MLKTASTTAVFFSAVFLFGGCASGPQGRPSNPEAASGAISSATRKPAQVREIIDLVGSSTELPIQGHRATVTLMKAEPFINETALALELEVETPVISIGGCGTHSDTVYTTGTEIIRSEDGVNQKNLTIKWPLVLSLHEIVVPYVADQALCISNRDAIEPTPKLLRFAFSMSYPDRYKSVTNDIYVRSFDSFRPEEFTPSHALTLMGQVTITREAAGGFKAVFIPAAK